MSILSQCLSPTRYGKFIAGGAAEEAVWESGVIWARNRLMDHVQDTK